MTTRNMTVAGALVPDALHELTTYAIRHHGTVQRYDLAPVGDPDVLTLDEVERTRVVASRISHAAADWFVARALSAPWSAVPHRADLRQADPGESDGLYDAALALYRHFASDAPQQVAGAKIHKVLHMKRPGLVPILDSRLRRAYRPEAREQARLYSAARPERYLYWAAIRADLLDSSNIATLEAVRGKLSRDEDERVQKMAELTDLRLTDAVSWRASA